MSRFRALDPETAQRSGWDADRKVCFEVAPYEKGQLEDVMVLDWHTYGPESGILAVSIPSSSRFVIATVGLPRIEHAESSSASRSAATIEVKVSPDELQAAFAYESARPEFDAMRWEDYEEIVKKSDESSETIEDDGFREEFLPPYGVIFQVIAEQLNLRPSSPGDLINVLMGPEPRQLAKGGEIYETPVAEVLEFFPEVSLYWNDGCYITTEESAVLRPQVQSTLAQVALLASSEPLFSHHVTSATRSVLASVLANASALLPYDGFARAAFDADPRSMFMALYKCLENLYAYSRVSELINDLNLESTWIQTAETLANRIKWRPQEESSLADVLALCSPEAPIEKLYDALPGNKGTVPAKSNLPRSTASFLYALRNSIVHVRPGLKGVDNDVEDWNLLCVLLSTCVAVADSLVDGGKRFSDSEFAAS